MACFLRPVLVAFSFAMLVGVTSAQVESFATRRQAALAELLAGLEGHAEWCRGRRVFLARKEALLLVLELDPGNQVAREALGWKRDAEGVWQAPEKEKTFKDYDKRAAAEAPERLSAVIAPFVERMHALLDEELSPAERELAQQDVLRYAPDDARVHAQRDEVRLEERWVMRETAVAAEGRARLRELVRAAFEGVPRPTRGEPTPKEAGFGLPWKGPFVTPLVRALGTGEEEEPLRALQAVNAAARLFHELFGGEASLPEDCTVYLLAHPDEKAPFLEHHPELDERARAAYAKLEGTGIQGTGDFVFWADGPARRIDGVVRIALGWLFADGFGITLDQAWIHEGFGLYLTRALVRTRLSWFVQPSPNLDAAAETELRKKLQDPETNWVDEAFHVLQRESRPRFVELMKKNALAYTVEDVLYAYVLAAYLLEARWQETPELLRRVGGGAPVLATIEETLGLAPDVLDAQVVRWLSERR